jgi:hypothetical protein
MDRSVAADSRELWALRGRSGKPLLTAFVNERYSVTVARLPRDAEFEFQFGRGGSDRFLVGKQSRE